MDAWDAVVFCHFVFVSALTTAVLKLKTQNANKDILIADFRLLLIKGHFIKFRDFRQETRMTTTDKIIRRH